MIRNLVDGLLLSNNKVHLVSNSFELDFIPNENLTLHKIPANPERKRISHLFASLNSLIKIIRREDIQLIHSHHRFYEFLAQFVSVMTKTPTCITIHSETNNLKVYSYKSDVCIAVSQYLEKLSRANYFINDIRVIYNGTKLSSEVKYNRSDKLFKILVVGNFEEFRGWDVLIKAAAMIVSKPIKIVFVGKGKEERDIINLAAEHCVEIELLFSPDIPYNNYLNCDILVAPSMVSTFGMTIIEAGSVGLPIIASNVGGHNEIISDNYDGLLFESGNSINLAEKIMFMINNPDVASKFGERLRQKIKTYFSLEQMTQKYLEVYSELIKK